MCINNVQRLGRGVKNNFRYKEKIVGHGGQEWLCSNVSATTIGQMGLEMGWFPFGNGVCLIMKKAPSDSPIWQLKKEWVVTTIIFSNHKTY